MTIGRLHIGNCFFQIGTSGSGSGGGSNGHAETWVKYIGDTTWTPVSIQGSIYGDDHDWYPTEQIHNVHNVVELEIGTDVTEIGYAAFAYCSALTSITIPSVVTSIGGVAFYNCSGLTNVAIPNRVASIGEFAFEGCTGLTSMTIPGSVESIGMYAFNGCSSLTSMTFQGKTLTQIQKMDYYPWDIDPSIIDVAQQL